MKLDGLGQNLEQSLNNPERWLHQAEQQYLAAESMVEQVRKRDPSECDLRRSVGILNAITLMLALCIENAFKAVKASRNELIVDERGLVYGTRGGGRSGHALVTLANDINLLLSNSEVVLLERLTEINIWAGKYHAPITIEAFERAVSNNPNYLNITSDFISVRRLVVEASNIAGVASVLDT